MAEETLSARLVEVESMVERSRRRLEEGTRLDEDAHKIDEWVRRSPEQAYDVDFFQRFAAEAGWKVAR